MCEWRDIKGYEGLYQVSNTGLVKSLDRYVRSGGNHSKNFLKGRIRKTHEIPKGYQQIILCKDSEQRVFLVHRLVAEAFIPNTNNYPCINHKDGNPRNNSVHNLEWCTYKYNNLYNDRVNRCKEKISKTLTGRKLNRVLTDEQREHIRQGAINGWIKRKKSAIIEDKIL